MNNKREHFKSFGVVIGIIVFLLTAAAICIRLNENDSQEKIDSNMPNKVLTTASSNVRTVQTVDFSSNDFETTAVDTEVANIYYASLGYSPANYELQMLCTVVSSEAGYCEDSIQKAVAHTVINRVISDDFPDTIYEVVTEEDQYTAIHSYFDGQYREGLYPGSDAWDHSMDLCIEALNEYDFTNGATFYYNPHVSGSNDWFESLTLVYEDRCGRYFKMQEE